MCVFIIIIAIFDFILIAFDVCIGLIHDIRMRILADGQH